MIANPFEMSHEGKKTYEERVPAKARQIVDSIESIAETYSKQYTGPGDEACAFEVIMSLVNRLRTEL
jgi:hypothetical protein